MGYESSGLVVLCLLLPEGSINVTDVSCTGVVDPTLVRDLSFEALGLSENPVTDLSSPRGKSLRRLALEAAQVTDLTLLKDRQMEPQIFTPGRFARPA